MAQKATAARKPALKIAKGSSPKKSAAPGKPSVLDKVKKALGKVVTVPAAEAKVSAKAKGKGLAAKPAKAEKQKPVKGEKVARQEEPQIEKAKAALKKQSKATAEAQAAPKVEVKPARTRKISIDINPNEASGALSAKWATLFKKAEQIESKPYNMKAVFEEKTAIVHKVLGWGYIMANRNDRLEVLFKDGIKYLISNYKA